MKVNKNVCKGFYRGAGTTTLLFLLSYCGIWSPHYINYQDSAGTQDDSTPGTPECEAAIAAFTSAFETAITGTCASAGCHTTTTIAGNVLQKIMITDRATILSYANSDLAAFKNYVLWIDNHPTKGTKHGGGQSAASALSETTLDAWITAEASCTE
jgi:hypothetical protein